MTFRFTVKVELLSENYKPGLASLSLCCVNVPPQVDVGSGSGGIKTPLPAGIQEAPHVHGSSVAGLSVMDMQTCEIPRCLALDACSRRETQGSKALCEGP